MRRAMVAAGAAALVGVVLVAGCSRSGKSSNSAGLARDAASSSAAGPQNATAPKAVMDANGGAGGATESSGGTTPDGAKATPIDVTDPRSLIRTADMQVSVPRGTSVFAQADRASTLVTAAGGEVYADDRTSGDNPTVSLTLKVPPESLNRVLGQLATLGKETGRSLSTRDVTTEVADVASRVLSARGSILRLRTLYDHATKVGDIIAIENELAQREADLESLEAKQRSLAAQTSMATVQLTLSTATPPAPVKKHHTDKGFLGGLASGWRHFTASASALATVLGAALPFLILAALVIAVVFVVRRHRPHPVVAPSAPGSGEHG